MKKSYAIAIDGGTTNTRVRLINLSDLSIVSAAREAIGAKDTTKVGRERLEEAISYAISKVLKDSDVSQSQVLCVVISGMITSEAGLLEVPHVKAPAGLKEISQGVLKRLFPKIWPEPILFIPGVKTLSEDPLLQDIMRGEECETLGIIKLMEVKGPTLLILPGSHTKFVFVDEENRIEGSLTTIAGELANALVDSTLIGKSLKTINLSQIDEEFLLKGFQTARQWGITRSFFLIRLLDLMSETTPDQRKSFMWGAIVGTDLLALERDPRFLRLTEKEEGKVRIFIGGGDPLRTIFGKILESWSKSHMACSKVLVVPPDVAEKASAVGAISVALSLGID